jgi:hypothetical protein
MQASSACAPAALQAAVTSSWAAGLRVAQLTKIRPSAPLSSESPSAAKIWRMAASSVTTVRMTSEAAVTSARVAGAGQPSSAASSSCESAGWLSKTALTVAPTSLRRRAMLAPMRPTPTIAILESLMLMRRRPWRKSGALSNSRVPSPAGPGKRPGRRCLPARGRVVVLSGPVLDRAFGQGLVPLQQLRRRALPARSGLARPGCRAPSGRRGCCRVRCGCDPGSSAASSRRRGWRGGAACRHVRPKTR